MNLGILNRRARLGNRLMRAVRWYIKQANDTQCDEVRRILGEGADVDYSYAGCTVLGKAVRSPWCHPDVVRLLLERGANVNGAQKKGLDPPLVEGCHQSTPERLRLLVDAGADVNAVDRNGRMPLTELTAWADAELVEYFLTHGANPNIGYFNGNNPLHFAALLGRSDLTALYIRYGADASLPNTKGLTALQLATIHDNGNWSSPEEYAEVRRALHATGVTESDS